MTSPLVSRSTTVAVEQERAFDLFVGRLGDFKPPEHNLLATPIAETVFEPWVGGSILDRSADGSECRWGRVLAFDRPHRVVFSWNIGPTWQLVSDPSHASEVEVRFVAEGVSSTRVHIEHRQLDRHGPGWEAVRAGVDDDAGWPLYLSRFSALAQTSGAA